MSKGPFFFFAMVKIISGAFGIYQGRETHKITKPILKDYKVAQISGQIQMTERKSKDIDEFLKKLKVLIWICAVGGFLTIAASNGFLHDEADRFLDQYYSTMNSTNTTEGSMPLQDMNNTSTNQTI